MTLCEDPGKPAYIAAFSRKTIFSAKKKIDGSGYIRSTGDRWLIPMKNKVYSDEYTKILKDHVLDFRYIHELF